MVERAVVNGEAAPLSSLVKIVELAPIEAEFGDSAAAEDEPILDDVLEVEGMRKSSRSKMLGARAEVVCAGVDPGIGERDMPILLLDDGPPGITTGLPVLEERQEGPGHKPSSSPNDRLRSKSGGSAGGEVAAEMTEVVQGLDVLE